MFLVFIFLARSVSASRTIYRAPIITKIDIQPNLSLTNPNSIACIAAPM